MLIVAALKEYYLYMSFSLLSVAFQEVTTLAISLYTMNLHLITLLHVYVCFVLSSVAFNKGVVILAHSVCLLIFNRGFDFTARLCWCCPWPPPRGCRCRQKRLGVCCPLYPWVIWSPCLRMPSTLDTNNRELQGDLWVCSLLNWTLRWTGKHRMGGRHWVRDFPRDSGDYKHQLQ